MKMAMKITGLRELKDKLEHVPTHIKLETLRATHQTGKYLVKAVRRRFKQQGPGWRPLHPTYRDWRKRMGLGSAIMMRTLRLYHSIHFVRSSYTGGFVGVQNGYYPPIRSTLSPTRRKRFRRFPKNIFRLRREQMSVTTVAKIHEYGLGRSPRRPFFGPTAVESRKIVRQIYSRALARALKK